MMVHERQYDLVSPGLGMSIPFEYNKSFLGLLIENVLKGAAFAKRTLTKGIE